MKTLPILNEQQTQILHLLYNFRFLTIKQLQKHFNHKYPSRIQEWLNDLKDKQYISIITDKKDPTVPFIYCLATKARYVLESNPDYDKNYLARLYKEKNLKQLFINHLLFIVDIYLFFQSRLEEGTTLHFLTQQNLVGYDFLPDELPDAYIAVESKDGTDKYFLELFDEYRDKTGYIRFTVRKYLEYSENGSWQANTNNSPFPSLLFVMANERRRKFTHIYSKAKLDKTFEEIILFTTTQDLIKNAKEKTNVWKQVT